MAQLMSGCELPARAAGNPTARQNLTSRIGRQPQLLPSKLDRQEVIVRSDVCACTSDKPLLARDSDAGKVRSAMVCWPSRL
jgi:hypothetical protein